MLLWSGPYLHLIYWEFEVEIFSFMVLFYQHLEIVFKTLRASKSKLICSYK